MRSPSMRTPLMIGALLALTAWPALAQDMSYDGDGRGWRDDYRSHGREWRQNRGDMGDRAMGDRADRGDRDSRGDRPSSMHAMRGGMGNDMGGMRNGMGGMRNRGGSAFVIRSGDTRLAVRCDAQETMRACVDAALTLFDRVQARATAAKPDASAPPAANQ
ncbi:hypothetical protein C7450_108341 [Chelatococcus asaccharovorans]|uniref:Uncharacterized protein n=2 Tax=Chelatococcus asaccharovorans TaxID=28210 RepID=A0A2V3U4J4_9HYPH|nr:hypothetical protein C7450_108341 [Chelatococcus asaccharovorans]